MTWGLDQIPIVEKWVASNQTFYGWISNDQVGDEDDWSVKDTEEFVDPGALFCWEYEY